MWDNINTYAEKNHMIGKRDSIVVGLSGGADSVCLFRYLLSVREKMQLNIFAVHVNHLLRDEEAERDQQFVKELCEKWMVPLKIFRKSIREEKVRRRCSLEEAGRLVRYDCFNKAAKEWGCNKIAVAHHRNDLAETMIFRMIRGTGIAGLTGILPVNDQIIRPLLGADKSEILKILEELGQDYVEDSTNQEEMYSRNCIRHRILPQMQQINDQAVSHLGQLSDQLREFNDYLDSLFEKIYADNVIQTEREYVFPEENFQQLKPLERKEILRRMLFSMAGRRRDISAIHVEQLLKLMEKSPGKKINLPYGLTAVKTGEGLVLMKTCDFVESETQATKVEKPCVFVDRGMLEETGEWTTSLKNGRKIFFQLRRIEECKIIKSDCVKYFDYDTIKSKLCLRTRQTGDYFIMDREGRHKSLKRYFIDEKMAAEQRDKVLLLAEEDHVLWILGGRISEAYKVGAKTEWVLKVQIIKTPEEE